MYNTSASGVTCMSDSIKFLAIIYLVIFVEKDLKLGIFPITFEK